MQPMARPPIRQGKTGVLDYPDYYEKHMQIWKDSLLRQGISELNASSDFNEVSRYIDLLDGKGYWDSARPSYRSRYYDNYLADQRREALSGLSDIRPALEISCRVDAFKHQGEIAHKYIRYLWSDMDLDLEVVRWVDHALFGSGFLKIVAGPGGLFEFSSHGMDSVIPVLMPTGKLQGAAAVIHKTYQRMEYFLAKFPREKCEGLERYSTNISTAMQADTYQRPDAIPEYTWNAMSPVLKRRKMAQYSNAQGPAGAAPGDSFPRIDLVEIYVDDWSINETDHEVLVKHPDLSTEEHNYHYIVPPGCRLFPRKRLVVFAGDRVMYDGPSPFWHGLYPFAMLQLNPCVWAPGGMSKFRDLIPQVTSINRIGAGVDEAVMKALNMNVVTKKGVIPEAAWDAFQPGRPGQKVMLNAIAQVATDFRYMDPPSLPPYIAEFLRYCVDTVKRRSGSLDITGLARKKQAPGGEAIENMRDVMSAPFRLEGRYLEAALKDAGKQVVSNIFQFADLDQRLAILGADGMTYEDFDYRASTMVPHGTPPEDHWKMFSINIAPGSSHGNVKYQRKVEAFNMRRQKDLSLRGLYRQTEFPESPDQVMRELAEEAKMGIGVAPPKGRQQRMSRSQRQGNAI
jgi:hypothetical protein